MYTNAEFIIVRKEEMLIYFRNIERLYSRYFCSSSKFYYKYKNRETDDILHDIYEEDKNVALSLLNSIYLTKSVVPIYLFYV